MSLDKYDLKAIKQIVAGEVDSRVARSEAYLKDYVEYAIDKSELKLSGQIKDVETKLSGQIREVDRNNGEMIETDQKILDYLGNHEKRIVRVEKKLDIKPS